MLLRIPDLDLIKPVNPVADGGAGTVRRPNLVDRGWSMAEFG
jgi:hypothetical protein